MTGASAALPIVGRFLVEATSEESPESFPVPDGITESPVALAEGGWPAECGAREIFLAGTEPRGIECLPFEIPDWGEARDWGRALKRGAVRFLEELIAQQLEQRRSRR